MKKLLILLIFFLHKEVIYSQDVDFKWGEPFDYTRKSAFPEYLGKNKNNLYILKGRDNEKVQDMYLEIINLSNMELVKRIDFSKEIFPITHNNRIEKVLYDSFNNRIIIISDFTIEKETTVIISAIDVEGQLLFENKKIGSYNTKNIRENAGYVFIPNNDYTRYLFFLDSPVEKKGYEKFQSTILNNDFDIVKTNEIQLPYLNKYFKLIQFIYDNSLNIYLLGVKLGEDELDTSKNILICYDNNTSSSSEINLPMPGRNVIGHKMFIDKDGYMVFSGFFKNSDLEGIPAIFYTKFNPKTGEIVRKAKYTFSTDNIVGDAMKVFDFNMKLPEKFVLRDIINTHSDTLVFLAERDETIIFRGQGGFVMKNIYEHIICIKVDLNGKIINTSLIPKKQVLQLDESKYMEKRNTKLRQVLSYYLLERENNIQLVYNDNIKNMEIKKVDNPKATKFDSETALVLAEINNSGKVSKNIVLPDSKEMYVISTQATTKIDSNTYLVFGISRTYGKQKIGILRITGN